MNPIDEAVRAVSAARAGDTTDAQEHLRRAHRNTQKMARRQRQVVDIAGLVIAGNRDRAEGLALVHLAEFPSDAELLAGLMGTLSPRGTEP